MSENEPQTVTVPMAPPSGPNSADIVAVKAVSPMNDLLLMIFAGELVTGLSAVIDQPTLDWRTVAHVILGAVGAVVRYRQNTVVR